MKRLQKILALLVGMLAIAFLMGGIMGDGGSKSKDMEAAAGSSPSPSYQYHLQIFHAF